MKQLVSIAILIVSWVGVSAQTSKEFWFAPPEVSSGHVSDLPINLRIATGDSASTVTIDQPALGGAAFSGAGSLVYSIAANSQITIDLSAYQADLETTPTDSVLNTGLHIVATNKVTAYYELNTTYNPEIFALKGDNGLGTEFYTPFNNRFGNDPVFNPDPYKSFDIVATEDNTTVLIYPRVPLEGGTHPALTSFSVTLNRGQTYSGSVNSTNGADSPAGTAIISDKPIAVSVKDDSAEPAPWGTCRDLLGDQIVPVDIIGDEYIAQKGFLNNNIERFFVTAIANGTEVTIDGVLETTLFAGETYDYQLDDAFAYISTSHPVYVLHVSGFGCEMGAALLPPLNCAGSEQVSFVRSQADPRLFALSVLIRAGGEGDFLIDGDSTLLQASDFTAVPNTGGAWMGAQVTYTDAEMAAGVAHQITNSSDVFTLGIINGGSSSGCRFGYFSEFSAEIIVDAGSNQIICATDSVELDGTVTGGTTTGEWTTTGTGVFLPDNETLDATYVPSLTDLATGYVTLTLTSTGACFPISDDMTVTFSPAPSADAGTDLTSCANNPTVTLNGSVTIATGGTWTGGAGTFNPDNNTLNATYTPTTSEIASGQITLTLTTTGNGTCDPATDDVIINITNAPTAEAGANQTACANNASVTLSGSVSNAVGGVWSGGTGSFSPSATALSAVYTPSSTEIANGTVTLVLTTTGNGSCLAESDSMTITINSAPLANAGADQNICENNATINLNGTVTGASGGQWTGGLGTFTPDANTLNATYTPTATEIASGSLTLTLTTTGNGVCNAEADNMTITFTPAPTANAGNNLNSCANNPEVTLNGAVNIATGGVWTGGTGSFNPGNSTLGATYTPSATEIANGSVTLTLTTTGNGNCASVSDGVLINIAPSPIVDAGANQTSCSNKPEVVLNGSISNATGGIWSGGNGSFNPNTTALNAVYTPSAAEIAAGTVTLTLTSTGNGTCSAENDNMTITINSAPTVDAGIDQTICENNATIQLNGNVTGASGGQWTGGLGVFSPNANSLNATYTPTATEIASGSLTLTLTTTGNGFCNAETDNMIITFTAAPTADAGVDLNSCANNPAVSLNGSISIASGAVWTGGNGSFNPNNTTLNATYTPSSSEITAGSVTLTLTTTGNGNCNAVNDQVAINIDPSPIVNAGADLVSCSNNPAVSLSGTVTNAGGGVWSGGSGSFNPSPTALNATYTPSLAEISAGFVTLTLTSTGNNNCLAVSDNITISFTPSPTANAGIDQTICENNPTINLGGSVSIATGGQWTGGLGNFNPNANSLNASYTPTATEIAAGSITLILTTTGNGGCNPVSDSMQVNITSAPTADAGADLNSCANNPAVNLNGSITIASGAVWTGGSGSFNPNNTTLNATYTPSSGEIAAGGITLTLTSTGNGNCLAVTDQVTVNIADLPIANAGPNLTSCANKPEVNLAGTVTNASGGIWSGGTGTFVPDNADLNAIYTPSAAEIATGTVTLTLTTTGNGTCNADSDNMIISILNAPVANAGTDKTVCENNADVTLNGSINNAAGGQWSGGLGLFTPDANSLNTVYSPTANEITSGSITLTLTTTGNGVCNAESDNVVINFSPAPTVDAGADLTACANNPSINLNGIITTATGGQWFGGTGTFSPSSSTLNATYTPSITEINNGSVRLILNSTGNGNCIAARDSLTITINPIPLVDAGPDQNICVNNLAANLSGSVSGITNTGIWSTSGTGYFVPNNTTLHATYIASSADSLNGFVTLTLASTNNGSCLAITDQMTLFITPAGTANAGADVAVCSNNATVPLNGTIGGSAGGGSWSTSGTGVFSPNNTSLSATYTPSAFDIAQGSVTITLTANSCNAANDDMTVTITQEPVVDAGADQTICGTNLNVQLAGSISGASNTGIWSSTGTGTFVPNNTTLNATYRASQGDSVNQEVVLTLRASNIGSCLPVYDTVTIKIFPAASVNAGTDQSLCSNNAESNLVGTITGSATKGQWTTSGSGTFTPSSTELNATYIPSTNDVQTGTVNLILAATNSCNAASDFLVVDYTPAPNVYAGTDQVICATNPTVNLQGSFSGSTGSVWSSSGGGTFTPNKTDTLATYNPSAQDITDGAVTLYLTSTGNGNCKASSDSVSITFSSGIEVDAGTDQNVCSNAALYLQGKVTNGSTTGYWTTTGSGTFYPNDSILGAEYQYSSADSANGIVSLVLTSTNNGSCAAETDTVEISFGRPVNTNAGTDITVCASNMEVNLNGGISGGSTTGQWVTLGSGSFLPSDTILNATYQPSAADSIAKEVDVVLVSTNNGSCQAGYDTLKITIQSIPKVNAGIDQQICAGTPVINLSATTNNVSKVRWTSTGTGTFNPSDSSMSTSYTPGQQDMASGSWQLIIHSADVGVCSNVTDTMVVSVITPLAAALGYEESCVDFPVNFTDSTQVLAGNISGYHWKFGDGSSSSASKPVHQYDLPGNYDVTLAVTSSLGCVDSITESITVYGYPQAGFNVANNLSTEEPVQFLDASVDATSWYWHFGDGLSTSDDQDPSYTYNQSGSYSITQIVTSEYGCKDTAQSEIMVNETQVYPPILPTGFSPNKDSENDLLIVRGGPFLELNLKVFNNWGNLVFETNDPERGWDGTWKGKIQPEEDYVYTIYAVTIDGKEYSRTGSVAIIR